MKQNSHFDAIMSMHMQAELPWRPNQFWAIDLITADWGADEMLDARIAQIIADHFIWQIITRE